MNQAWTRPFGRHGANPLALLVTLQALAFCVPNLWVQAAQGVPLGSLLMVEVMNLSVITVLMLLFRTPRASRWAMLPLAVLSLATADFLHAFGGMPYVSAYMALAHTNLREALEYLALKRGTLVFLVFAAAGYHLAFGILAARCSLVGLARVRKQVLCGCLCLIAVIANWDTFPISFELSRHTGNTLALKNSFPIGFLLGTERAYLSSRGMRIQNRDFHFHAFRPVPVTGRETYVLVLGESACADFWSLNGYPYETDSRVRRYQAAGELSYFPRTAAQANNTFLALPMIITPATPANFSAGFKQKSLLTAFKEVGFTTYWISNQNEMAHMEEADFPILLHAGSGIKQSNYDEDIWPFVDTVLGSQREKTLIVIHLMGSHTDYDSRVPAGFQTPGLSGNSLAGRYARTICYTDYVLDGIIQRLGRLPGLSFLWYVSDHGQILNPNEVGHGSLEASVRELHVPMFVWTNRAFRARAGARLQKLDQRRNNVQTQGITFPTFLGLGGVSYPGLDVTRDISSDAFIADRKPEVINGEARARQIDDFLASHP